MFYQTLMPGRTCPNKYVLVVCLDIFIQFSPVNALNNFQNWGIHQDQWG